MLLDIIIYIYAIYPEFSAIYRTSMIEMCTTQIYQSLRWYSGEYSCLPPHRSGFDSPVESAIGSLVHPSFRAVVNKSTTFMWEGTGSGVAQ